MALQIFNADSLGVATVPAANLVHNGNFQVNQRALSSPRTAGGAAEFFLDRWCIVTSGQTASWTTSGIDTTVTAPAGGIRHTIEGVNIVGGTYTLSWSGTATATVGGSAVTNGGQCTLTGGSNAVIIFSAGTVTRVQLELGNVATTFQRREYSDMLRLCQRYLFIRFGIGANTFFLPGGMCAPTYAEFVDVLPVQMRAEPTFTWDGTPGNWYVVINGTTIAITAMSLVTHSTTQVGIQVSCTASAGYAAWLASQTASAVLAYSAEL